MAIQTDELIEATHRLCIYRRHWLFPLDRSEGGIGIVAVSFDMESFSTVIFGMGCFAGVYYDMGSLTAVSFDMGYFTAVSLAVGSLLKSFWTWEVLP